MEKCYKFRIYPNATQESLIQRTFGCCRFVYNRFLGMRIETYKESGETIGYVACSALLTQMKNEFQWLREVDSIALQEVLRNLDFAYKNFFRRVKKGEKPGFPRFKSKRDSRKSYKTKKHQKDNCIAVLDTHIKLPKLGLVRGAVSKQVLGRILSATVSQNPSGKYFVSVCCTDVEIAQYKSTGAVIGLDLGLKDFAVTSDGQTFENHKHLRKSEKRLARLQRQISRKKKGSANRDKARIKIAKLHEKIGNQRNDTLHNLTTRLVKDYDLIAIETLKPKNMVKNHHLAKSISDAAWGEFVRQLEYKAIWQHKALVKIDPFYPSSQTCSSCGAKNPKTKDLSVREWVCSGCGMAHDRDMNAAKNILNEGLRLLA